MRRSSLALASTAFRSSFALSFGLSALTCTLAGCDERKSLQATADASSDAGPIDAAPPKPARAPIVVEDVTIPVALIEKTTLDGPRAALVKGKRAELLAATAKIIRDAGSLLVTDKPIVVEEQAEALVVHGLPKDAHLSLAAQASVPDINRLFSPLRPSMRDGTGPVRYFAQGNGTLRGNDADGGARDALAPWMARLPARTDLRYVLREFCFEGDHRDLGIEVVREPAALSGAFLKRVRVVHAPADAGVESINVEGLNPEVTPESSEALLALTKTIAEGNARAYLVWGDRALWWSWSSVLHPEKQGVFTNKSVVVHGFQPNCLTPTIEEAAERIRAAALIEDARR
jgi:hypothetical protein